jgi:hypothetical protein
MIGKICFLCLIILLLLLYVCNTDSNNIIEYFSDFYKPQKTVIFVITRNILPSNYHYNQHAEVGFGDLIRAMMKIYQLCKKFNYEYIIDIQLHPISQYFIKNEHKYEDYILKNGKNIPWKQDPEQYIKTSSEKIIYFTTNADIDHTLPITDECKNYIKKILTPTDELEKYINQMINIIPYETYNILHYRIGDEYITKEKEIDITSFLNSFYSNVENNDVLMSDALVFKNTLKEHYKNIFTFDFPICHIGRKSDPEKIKNTLCEFFIMTKAKSIKTYSTYSWVSNFVMVIGKLYDIPIINIKDKT